MRCSACTRDKRAIPLVFKTTRIVSWLCVVFSVNDKMKAEEREVLLRNRFRLSRIMRPDSVMGILASRSQLSRRVKDKVDAQSDIFHKNSVLLAELSRGSSSTLDALRHALIVTKQNASVKIIEEASLDALIKRKKKENSEVLRSDADRMKSQCGGDLSDGSRRYFVENTDVEFYHRTKNDSYSMSSSPRGFALVVNLLASQVQGHSLVELLRQLGYECSIVNQQSLEAVKHSVREFANKPELGDVDSTVIALLCDDCQRFKGFNSHMNDVISMFDNAKCRKLRNKPKIFLLPLSYGEKTPMHCGNSSSSVTCCNMDDVDGSARLPTSSDFIVIYLRHNSGEFFVHKNFSSSTFRQAIRAYKGAGGWAIDPGIKTSYRSS